jgi:hypothetical protein
MVLLEKLAFSFKLFEVAVEFLAVQSVMELLVPMARIYPVVALL